MRRILLATIVLGSVLALAAPAEAGGGCGWGGWRGGGWRGGGWGGGWGGCGWGGGWGGCGWNSCGWNGCGWGGWGGGISIGVCRPVVSVGYAPNCYPYYGGAYPIPVSTYTYANSGQYYNPMANFVNYDLGAPTYQPIAYPTLSGLRVSTVTPASKANPTPLARVTSAEQYLRASKYLDLGDELFRAQNFHSALQKYKLAAQAAPDLAEAYWRQGHALIATSNFDLAAGAFKRAIALNPDSGRPGFALDKLYGIAGMAKVAHIENLAEWSLANSDSSTPYFLMGVTLHYDGQPDRAAPFFARAGELSGATGQYLAAFEPGAVAPSVTAIEAPRPAVAAPVAAPVVAAPVAAAIEI